MTPPPPRPGARAGGTMIELLVVVVTVAILSTIAAPQLQDAIARARAANALGDLNTVRLAAHQALAQNGSCPPSGELLFRQGHNPLSLAPLQRLDLTIRC